MLFWLPPKWFFSSNELQKSNTKYAADAKFVQWLIRKRQSHTMVHFQLHFQERYIFLVIKMTKPASHLEWKDIESLKR